MVHFSGKARKMNHIPLFCERSEQKRGSNYTNFTVTKKRLVAQYDKPFFRYICKRICTNNHKTNSPCGLACHQVLFVFKYDIIFLFKL
ncbi:MAG: hypothetical protein U5L45_06505 [Saprospiraceae bacterium]|nr:hypothetical protein [Saprospiraceae bacterium]